MEGIIYLALIIGAIIIGILIMRWIGAWMLRIDEIIKKLETTNKNLVAIHKVLKENGIRDQDPGE